jgi:hypothetical protein
MSARRPPRALLVVLLVVAILAFYFVLLGARGVSLLGDPRWVVKGLGIGILLLPLVGVAIVVQELRFGQAAQRLGEQLDREEDAGDAPDAADAPDTAGSAAESVPPAGGEPDGGPVGRTRGGRRDYAAADAAFARRRAEVEASPDSWRAWYRLGAAYGDAGDVARGRRAVRRAIALEARQRRAGSSRRTD